MSRTLAEAGPTLRVTLFVCLFVWLFMGEAAQASWMGWFGLVWFGGLFFERESRAPTKVIVQATRSEAPRSREMVPSRNTPFRPVELGIKRPVHVTDRGPSDAEAS